MGKKKSKGTTYTSKGIVGKNSKVLKATRRSIPLIKKKLNKLAAFYRGRNVKVFKDGKKVLVHFKPNHDKENYENLKLI